MSTEPSRSARRRGRRPMRSVLLTSIAALAVLVAGLGVALAAPVPSGNIQPSVWEPTTSSWVNGNAAGWSEGDTVAMTARIDAGASTANADGDWDVTLCAQLDDASAQMFLEFDSWDTTETPTHLPGSGSVETAIAGLATDSLGLVGAYADGGTVNITSVGTPYVPAKIAGKEYVCIDVSYTYDGTGDVWLTWGGVLTEPGDTVLYGSEKDSIVGTDVGSSSQGNGTFQVRIQGSGDKTINFHGSDIASAAEASLRLTKQVVNTGGGTATADEWTLTASGTSLSGTGTLNDPDDGTASLSGTVEPGTFMLSESDGPANYTAADSWVCTGDGTFARGDDDNPNNDTITLAAGESASCTIVNTFDAPTLTLVKEVVNTGGGTATADAWALNANDGTANTSWSGNGALQTDGTAQVSGPVVADTTYTLSEGTGPAGYDADAAWVCDGDGTFANGDDEDPNNDTITLAGGQSATCTITNTYVPPTTLTLVKEVDNTAGGSADADDWALYANDGAANTSWSGNPTTGSDRVTGDVTPGTAYTLSEGTGPAGYAAGDTWVCTGDGTFANGDDEDPNNDTITLAVGESATCTITNTYVPPQLTLVKDVVNTGGGTADADDWALNANDGTDDTAWSGNPESGTAQVSGPVVARSLYTLSETGGDANYTAAQSWTCVGDIDNFDGADQISLDDGESATCTITNTYDPPTLTLVKDVDNGDGGQADPHEWPLYASDGTADTSWSGNPADGEDQVSGTVNAGTTYTLSEGTGPAGYDAGDAWACTGDGDFTRPDTIMLAAGESAVCTITNDDIAPTLTLEKVWYGPATIDGAPVTNADWSLSASDNDADTADLAAGATPNSGDVAANSVYTLAETGGPDLSGDDSHAIEAGTWSCDGGTQVGSTVELGLADDVTCEIANSYVAISVAKTVLVEGTCDAADAVTTDDLLIVEPGNVTFCIEVSNDGNVDLSVDLADVDADGAPVTAGGCADQDIAVAAGATVTRTCTVAVSAGGQYSPNTMTATGTTPGGTSVTDDDEASVSVLDISFDKEVGVDTNGDGVVDTWGAEGSTLDVMVGDDVYYRFTVDNIGDVPAMVSVTDDDIDPALLATCDLGSGAGAPHLLGPDDAAVSCIVGPMPVEPVMVNLGDLDGDGFDEVLPVTSSFTNTATGSGCFDADTCDDDTDSETWSSQYNGFTPGFWKNSVEARGKSPRAQLWDLVSAHCGVDDRTTLSELFAGLEPDGSDVSWLDMQSPVQNGKGKWAQDKLYGDLTLVEALNLQGGSGTDAMEIVLRAGIASYLNACYNETLEASGQDNWPLTPEATLLYLDGALDQLVDDGDRDLALTFAGYLDTLNNGAHLIIIP